MLLNRLWDKRGFEPHEKKAANIVAGVIMTLATLGVISAVFPQHAGLIWGGLALLAVGAMGIVFVCMFIYVFWLILSDTLR
jgi:protein-S-isoprenylcysteine O-methyltransferase Ste14